MVVIAFEQTHAAMAAQKLLGGMRFDVIPTPKEISAGCGIALRLRDDLMEQAMAALSTDDSIASQCSWHYI